MVPGIKPRSRAEATTRCLTSVEATMFRLVILACIGVVTVRADLAGVAVAVGDCLCVSGTGVNARDRPGTSGTSVIAVYSTGSCFKMAGGPQTVGAYRWFEVTDGSKRFWIAGNYLTKSSTSACNAGACGDQVKELACQLLNNPRITAARSHPSGKTDNAFAYDNLRDTCSGLRASRSSYVCNECSSGAPGGTTCLSVALLEYLAALARTYSIYITELAGACHSCQSRHYDGTAVDLRVRDVPAAQRQAYISTCNQRGGRGIDERDHIHCQF